jgi:hypothetical protein
METLAAIIVMAAVSVVSFAVLTYRASGGRGITRN